MFRGCELRRCCAQGEGEQEEDERNRPALHAAVARHARNGVRGPDRQRPLAATARATHAERNLRRAERVRPHVDAWPSVLSHWRICVRCDNFSTSRLRSAHF